MAELLLELFSEEIPARMQARAAEDLKRLVTEGLKAQGLAAGDARAYATPRRLTLVVEGVPAKSPDLSEERKGPRVNAPEQAIAGFVKSAGLKSIKDATVVKDDKKGDFYVVKVEKPGRAADAIISDVVPAVFTSFPWPKSMRFNCGDLFAATFEKPQFDELRWVRPLHSIICLLDGKVVRFNIGPVESGKGTRGHRFLGNEPFDVSGAADYVKSLKAHKVILDPQERAALIAEQARALAKEHKLALVEDEALLAENAGLTEWPLVLMGSFEEAFLAVPAECLMVSMKQHQKCFSLKHPRSGKLANRFLLVSNLTPTDGGAHIIAGNEKVIAARLSDAKFFWEQDLKKPLDEMASALAGITFHDKLGSQKERVERIAELAFQIAGSVDAVPQDARRAAQLAKADLVSGMVGEFPELQGLMGRYYAEAGGIKPEIARAIELHYKPKGPTDTVPLASQGDAVAIAVALADKLDTLVGFWAIGEKPTGSGDPYQLRRAALGVIRIVLENDLRLPIRKLVIDSLLQHLSHLEVAFGLTLEAIFDSEDSVGADLEEAVLSGPWVWAWEEQVGRERFKQTCGLLDKRAAEIELSVAELDIFHGTQDLLNQCLRDVERYADAARSVIAGPPLRYPDEQEYRRLSAERLTEETDRIRKIATGFGTSLLAFFADRLKVHLREKGARHDLIDAVFALGGQDDLALIVKRVEALGAFLKTDDGATLLAGVKRASNILRDEEKKDKKSYAAAADSSLLREPQELALYQAIHKVKADTVAAINVENFAGAMRALAELRDPVDAFFDKVTVNVTGVTEAAALRANRLALLSEIRAATLNVADFSKIAG